MVAFKKDVTLRWCDYCSSYVLSWLCTPNDKCKCYLCSNITKNTIHTHPWAPVKINRWIFCWFGKCRRKRLTSCICLVKVCIYFQMLVWTFALKSTHLFTSALKVSAYVYPIMSTSVNKFIWLFCHNQYYFGCVFPKVTAAVVVVTVS